MSNAMDSLRESFLREELGESRLGERQGRGHSKKTQPAETRGAVAGEPAKKPQAETPPSAYMSGAATEASRAAYVYEAAILHLDLFSYISVVVHILLRNMLFIQPFATSNVRRSDAPRSVRTKHQPPPHTARSVICHKTSLRNA